MRQLPEIVQRIYTAAPLIGIGIAATFYFNFALFIFVDTLLILLLGWEFARIIGYERLASRGFYLLALLVGCVGIYYLPLAQIARISTFMGALLVGNMVIALSIGKQPFYPKWALATLGGIYLTLAWHTLCVLKSVPIYLGMGLLIVVLTDTLAYIVGKRWGSHKLAPDISPYKTWEGCLAGLFGPVFVMLIIDKLSGYLFHITFEMATILVCTSLVAISGDLFESAIKRQSGLKDSGDGLPGHGGWLDRFDSLVCAMPIFAAALHYLTTL